MLAVMAEPKGKPGRKELPDEEKRKTPFHPGFTPPEIEDIRRIAKQASVTPTDWIRMIVMQTINETKQATPATTEPVRHPDRKRRGD